jgi:hypothetical protein
LQIWHSASTERFSQICNEKHKGRDIAPSTQGIMLVYSTSSRASYTSARACAHEIHEHAGAFYEEKSVILVGNKREDENKRVTIHNFFLSCLYPFLCTMTLQPSVTQGGAYRRRPGARSRIGHPLFRMQVHHCPHSSLSPACLSYESSLQCRAQH